MSARKNVTAEYRFAPADRRKLDGLAMHDYVRERFTEAFGGNVTVQADTERELRLCFTGVARKVVEKFAFALAPKLDLSPLSSYLVYGEPEDVGDPDEPGVADEEETDAAEEARRAAEAAERRRKLRSALAQTSAKTEALEKVRCEIESLTGVEEFKALCRDLISIAQSDGLPYLQDYFSRCALCLCISGGDGFSKYLSLLARLLDATGIKRIDHYGKDVLEIKKAETDASVEETFSRLSGGSDLIALDLTFRTERAGTEGLRRFLRELQQLRGSLLPVFKLPQTGEEERRRMTDELSAVFPLTVVDIPPFTTEEYCAYAMSVFAAYGREVDPDMREKIEALIVQKRNREHFYGFHSVKTLVEEIVYQKNLTEARQGRDMSLVIREKDLQPLLDQCREEQGGLEALDEMIGVDEIRGRIDEIVVQLELAKSLPLAERPCMHMLFTGNPGTGKTTVARILGRVLKEKGVLSKGQFYERTGRDLVGKYIGETAPITNAICRDAYGSVLFIDEAYTLYRSAEDGKDFGREALDTLITQMENHRQDFIVILSGYSDEMQTLLQANPGLASRIPHEVAFRNFTREELAKIFMSMAQRKYRCGAGLAEESERYFLSLSDHMLEEKSFANARFVRNLYERTVSKAALRYQSETGKRIDSGTTLELVGADFRNAAGSSEFQKLQEKAARPIGFA
jgi:energy-coupling factor transporter ATP-binding protein EcfA2